MDVKHKHVFAKLKITGMRDSIMVDVGGIAKTMQALTIHMHEAQMNMKGPIQITLSPYPLVQGEDAKPDFSGTMGIDPSMIIPESELPDDMKEQLARARKEQEDPLLIEYRSLSITSVREATTPERIGELKAHMNQHYKGTEHWDGIHKF